MSGPLLNCPFCGGGAMFTVEQRETHPDYGGHSAMCGTCGAGIGYVFACGDDPQPRLRELWNRRAPTDVLAPDLLAALLKAVKLLRMHANAEDLDGEHFDLTDCPPMRPIFAAIARATGATP